MSFIFGRRGLLKRILLLSATTALGLKNVFAADLKVYPRRPRFHSRKKRLNFYDRPSGWCWNVSHIETKGRVAHFAKPAYKFTHHDRRHKQKAGRTVVFRSGRISGSGKIKNLRLFEADGFQAFQKPRDRLNLTSYSDGIEKHALDAWGRGRKDEAIAALKVGVSYAELRDPLDIRLLDLLAGLLVRTGREAELRELMPILERELEKVATVLQEGEPDSWADESLTDPKRKVRLMARSAKRRHKKFQNYQAALQKRLQNWAGVGSWRSEWAKNSPRKWNGLAI